MSLYEGPVKLVSGDREYDADVTLILHNDGGLRSWDGYGHADLALGESFGNEDVTLRLPDQSEARVFLTSLVVHADERVEIELAGSGPPPSGTGVS